MNGNRAARVWILRGVCQRSGHSDFIDFFCVNRKGFYGYLSGLCNCEQTNRDYIYTIKQTTIFLQKVIIL